MLSSVAADFNKCCFGVNTIIVYLLLWCQHHVIIIFEVIFVARLKENRANLHTTVDADLLQKIKELAVSRGTVKYGQFVEEGLRLVLEKYGKK